MRPGLGDRRGRPGRSRRRRGGSTPSVPTATIASPVIADPPSSSAQVDPDPLQRGPGPDGQVSRPAQLAGRRSRPKTSVAVNCAASIPPARSSTAMISVTVGPSVGALGVHDDVDRLADERVERGDRQVGRHVGQLGDEPQPGQRLPRRAGVDRGVAGDPRRQREQERQRLAIAHLADDGDVGRHAQEPRHESAQVDARAVGSRRPGLHRCDVRQRHVGLEHLLRDHDPERRVELGGAAAQQRRLAAPRRTGEHDREPGAHAGGEELGRVGGQHPPLDELVELGERHAGELPDVHHDVPAATQVAVDDVQPGAVVELGVLEPLGRVELAVRRGRSVEQPGERADDVVVVDERPRRGSRSARDAASRRSGRVR